MKANSAPASIANGRWIQIGKPRTAKPTTTTTTIPGDDDADDDADDDSDDDDWYPDDDATDDDSDDDDELPVRVKYSVILQEEDDFMDE